MAQEGTDALDRARKEAGLSRGQLWMRYFGLGGMSPELELDAVLHGALVPSDRERDRIVHALNERFTELGRNHPVPYSGDSDPSATS